MSIIRPAGKNEWNKLQILNDEVFIDNHQYDPDLKRDWALSEAGKKYFQELVVDADSCCFVAEENGVLVGYIAASPKQIDYRLSTYLEIDNMGVSPAYRSKGFGSLLIDEVKKWAKTRGYNRLFVNSYIKNTPAISFYKKHGFEEIDMSLELAL